MLTLVIMMILVLTSKMASPSSMTLEMTTSVKILKMNSKVLQKNLLLPLRTLMLSGLSIVIKTILMMLLKKMKKMKKKCTLPEFMK